MFLYRCWSPDIVGNEITDNSARGGGGAACFEQCSNIELKNNLIAGNEAPGGGGITCSASQGSVHNNTIAGNSAGMSE